MAIGCFLDKEHSPSEKEVRSTLGARYPFWQHVVQFLYNNYEMAADFSYGGKKYGWNLWYRKSGKSLVSLYPQTGGFVAQIVLGKDQTEQALEMKFFAKTWANWFARRRNCMMANGCLFRSNLWLKRKTLRDCYYLKGSR